MGKQSAVPDFKTIEAAKALYQELGEPFRPYYKFIIRVGPPKRSYLWAVAADNLDDIRLEKRGRRGSKQMEIEVIRDSNGVPVRDKNGQQIQRRFVEYTCGILYAPLGSNTIGPLDYEWALCMKIDGDLARKKTGFVEDGLIPYLGDLTRNNEVRKLKKIGSRGRPPKKSNSQDIKDRYGKYGGEVQDWIKEHSEELDTANFSHDEYRDPVTYRSLGIGADGYVRDPETGKILA